MDRKYTPHIRIPFSIFANPKYKQIPDTFKPYCLLLLMCLLKFVNNKTGKCYPRRETISEMSGLSYSTIYRATIHLKNAKIIQIKRFPSTLLYTIDPDFIYGVRSNRIVSGLSDRSDMSAGQVLIEHNTKELSFITKIIKRVVEDRGDQSKIISTLSSLSADTLKEAIKKKDNIYYVKMALEEKMRSEKKGKLVNIPNIIDSMRKKTHFGYQQAIQKRKERDGREAKTKDFLSKFNKKK
jgi:predicted double-glycine peptidase